MTKVIVLGATGFVGTLTLAALEQSGIEVQTLRAPRLNHDGAIVAAEVEHQYSATIKQLEDAFRGADVVINAAGNPDASSRDLSKLVGANSLLPGLIALACERAHVQRYIHVSSAAVQGRLPKLDQSPITDIFSRYSFSKACGETLALECAPSITTVYRPPSVHARDRRVTQMLTKLAASYFSSVAGTGNYPSPQALGKNVGSAIAHLALTTTRPPPVVIHPSEGITTGTLLEYLGNQTPRRVPLSLARLAIRSANVLAKLLPPLAANVRRAEMVWFGQEQASSWLTTAGWTPPVGHEGWKILGNEVRADMATRASAETSRPKILFGVTTGLVVRSFFSGQFEMLSKAGWDVVLVTTEEGNARAFAQDAGARFVPIEASRSPRPGTDLNTLRTLVNTLRAEQPDLAVWGTPKIGLLGPVASRMTKTASIYVLHGLRLETTHGFTRFLLIWCERLAATAAHEVVAVGEDVRLEAIRRRLVAPRRIRVLGSGSANGVTFQPRRKGARQRLGLPDDRPVVAFVGRITRDKGLHELLPAWRDVHAASGALLVLAGMREDDAQIDPLRTLLANTPGTIEVGHLQDLGDLYSAIDLLVLPSHREGYPTVVIEAAAFGVPAIVSDATGVRESVDDGETGLHFSVGDVNGLRQALLTLVYDVELRGALGKTAADRARRFEQHVVHRQWREYFSTFRSKR